MAVPQTVSQPRAAMLSGQRRSLNPYPLSLSLPPFFFRLFACPFSRLSNFPRFFDSTNMRLETNTISRRIALLRYLISGLEETKLHKSCTGRRQSLMSKKKKP